MNKNYPRMKCAIWNRPMARAAALKDGYPVGPVCAAAAGLIPGRGGASVAAGKPADVGGGGHADLFRDPLTLDMFAS
jgi:hypothetical protein